MKGAMALVVKLAWRSLWRNPRRTLIALASLALGVALVVFFESLRRGAFAQLVERAVRTQGGHLSLEHPDYRREPSVERTLAGAEDLRRRIARLDGVAGARIFVCGPALLKTGAGSAVALVVGVEPAVEAAESPLARRLVAGRYLAADDGRAAVLGRELARTLRVEPGRKVVVATTTRAGQMEEQLARVEGVFALGAPELDGYLVQVPLAFARELFGLAAGEATQIGVLARDPARLEPLARRLREQAAGQAVAVRSWQETMPDVAAFIQVYNAANAIQKGLLLGLVLLSVLNVLLMSVLERQKEFAVLLALGTPLRQLRAQVFLECAFLGLLGCAAGLALGAAAAQAGGIHGIDLGRFMAEGTTLGGHAYDLLLRPRPSPAILLGVGGVVLGATLGLSLVPLRLLGRVRPAPWLRG